MEKIELEDLQASVSPEIVVPPELQDSELYHVFISSSSTDNEWTKSLMEQLETRGLRVCFHERDFTPGRTILDNMSDCISQSQKVLLVLSPDFVKSRWCLLEANMSLFRDCLQRKPIVPVLLKQVSIPVHLCHLTYLEVEHPTFTQQLLKVLCTPNDQQQGSTVVPYQSPSVYNGKTLQPLIAVNEEDLNRYDSGIWSDMEVPDQLRLIIQDPQRYLQAISIINTVNRKKVRFRSVWVRTLFVIAAFILFLIIILAGLICIGVLLISNWTLGGKIFFEIVAIPSLIFVSYKLALVKKNEAKRIVRELQKAVGRANHLLLEENVLMGCRSNSKLFLVYVSLEGCRQEISEVINDDFFIHAVLRYSSEYTCCLAKKHFPFLPPAKPSHLEGGICFCQYVFYRFTLDVKKYKILITWIIWYRQWRSG